MQRPQPYRLPCLPAGRIPLPHLVRVVIQPLQLVRGPMQQLLCKVLSQGRQHLTTKCLARQQPQPAPAARLALAALQNRSVGAQEAEGTARGGRKAVYGSQQGLYSSHALGQGGQRLGGAARVDELEPVREGFCTTWTQPW